MREQLISAILACSNSEGNDGQLDNDFRDPQLVSVCNYLDTLTQFQKLRSQPDYPQLLRLATRNLHIRRYVQGEILVRQGDRGDGFFIILQGDVNVFVEHLESTLKKIRSTMKKITFLKDTLNQSPTCDEIIKLEQTIAKLQQLSVNDKTLLENNPCFLKQSSSRVEYLVKRVNHLGENRTFGEFSLAKVGKRTASILAESTEVVTAWMPYEIYHKVFDSEIKYKELLATKIQTFFAGVGDTHSNQISYFLVPRHIQRNQAVYREGEEANELFFLEDGNVQLTKQTEKSPSNDSPPLRLSTTNQNKVAILQSGQFFGFESTANDNQHYFTATGLTNEVKILVLSKMQLFQIPDYNFVQVLTKKSENSISRHTQRIAQITLARNQFQKKYLSSTPSTTPLQRRSLDTIPPMQLSYMQQSETKLAPTESMSPKKQSEYQFDNLSPLSPMQRGTKSVYFSPSSPSPSPKRSIRQKSKTVVTNIEDLLISQTPSIKEIEVENPVSSFKRSNSTINVPSLALESNQVESQVKKIQLQQIQNQSQLAQSNSASPLKNQQQQNEDSNKNNTMFEYAESFSEVKARLTRMKHLTLQRKEKVPSLSGNSPVRKLKKQFTAFPQPSGSGQQPLTPRDEDDQIMPQAFSLACMRLPSEKAIPDILISSKQIEILTATPPLPPPPGEESESFSPSIEKRQSSSISSSNTQPEPSSMISSYVKSSSDALAVFSKLPIGISDSQKFKDSSIMKRIQSLAPHKKSPHKRASLPFQSGEQEYDMSSREKLAEQMPIIINPLIKSNQQKSPLKNVQIMQSLSPIVKPIRNLERNSYLQIIPVKSTLNEAVPQITFDILKSQSTVSLPPPTLLQMRQKINSIEKDLHYQEESRTNPNSENKNDVDNNSYFTSKQTASTSSTYKLYSSLKETGFNSLKDSSQNSLRESRGSSLKAKQFSSNSSSSSSSSQQKEASNESQGQSTKGFLPNFGSKKSIRIQRVEGADNSYNKVNISSGRYLQNSVPTSILRKKAHSNPLGLGVISSLESANSIAIPQSYIDTEVLRRVQYKFNENNLLEKSTGDESPEKPQVSYLNLLVNTQLPSSSETEREQPQQLDHFQFLKKQKLQQVKKNNQKKQQQQPQQFGLGSSKDLIGSIRSRSSLSIEIQQIQPHSGSLSSRTYFSTHSNSPLKGHRMNNQLIRAGDRTRS